MAAPWIGRVGKRRRMPHLLLAYNGRSKDEVMRERR